MKGLPTYSLKAMRLPLLAVAVAIGCYAAGLSLHHGGSASRAATGGLVLGIGMFVAWEAYHLRARRNNGLLVALFPFMSFQTRLRAHQETDLRAMIAISVVGGLVTGLLALVPDAFARRRRKPASVDHPMADASLDASPTG